LKKRLFSWLLTFAMLLSMVPSMAFTAAAAPSGDGFLFKEYFDTAGTDVLKATDTQWTTYKAGSNDQYKGTVTHLVETWGESDNATTGLKLYAKDDFTDKNSRSWLETKNNVLPANADYTIKTRVMVEENGTADLTSILRLTSLRMPKAGTTGAAANGDCDYELRSYQSKLYLAINKVDKSNRIGSEGAEAYLYDASGKAYHITAGKWYVVTVTTDAETSSVTTKLYDDKDTLLASRTITGAKINAGPLGIDNYVATKTKSGNTHSAWWDYITVECHHHNVTTTTAAKDPTCGTVGNTAATKCVDCNKVLTTAEEIPATGEHTYDDGVTTTPPTTTTEGVKTFTCEVCGDTYTEKIPVLEDVHTHNMTYHEAVDATCSSDGNVAYYTCDHEDCADIFYADEAGEDVLGDVTVEATPNIHSLKDVAAVAPTATAPGHTAHKACEHCDYTEGNKQTTYLLELGEGVTANVAAGAVVEGTKVIVSSADKAVKAVYVNGTAVTGTTFTMTGYANVTADFVDWKTVEEFDVEPGSALPATMTPSNRTNGEVKIENKGELTLETVTGGRVGVFTADGYSGSYVIETRIKSNPLSGGYTMLYVNGAKFPRYNSSKYSQIRYDMRLYGGLNTPWLELNKPLAAGTDTGTANLDSTNGNKITGGVDGTGSRMFFYANGNPGNVVTDTAAMTYETGEWYTIKYYVDSTAKTVTTEFWNSNGTALLGSRTLYDAILASDVFEIESQAGGTTVIDYVKYACLHANTEVLEGTDAGCGVDGKTEGLKCNDCDEILVEQTVTEEGWDHVLVTETTEPTVDTEGKIVTTCTKGCGYEETVTIPMLCLPVADDIEGAEYVVGKDVPLDETNPDTVNRPYTFHQHSSAPSTENATVTVGGVEGENKYIVLTAPGEGEIAKVNTCVGHDGPVDFMYEFKTYMPAGSVGYAGARFNTTLASTGKKAIEVLFDGEKFYLSDNTVVAEGLAKDTWYNVKLEVASALTATVTVSAADGTVLGTVTVGLTKINSSAAYMTAVGAAGGDTVIYFDDVKLTRTFGHRAHLDSGDRNNPDRWDLVAAEDAKHTATELKGAVAAHYHCEACNAYFTEGVEAGEPGEATTLEALTGEAPEHIFDDEYDATCNFEGCGYTREVEQKHTCVLTEVTANDPTCVADGNSAYWYCTAEDSCGKYFSDAEGKFEIEKDSWIINATGEHSYTVFVSETAGTCTTEGTVTYKCATCDATKEQNTGIVENNHKWGEGVETKAPTCTTPGELTFTCEYNKAHTKTSDIAINAEAHKWGEGVETTKATCTTPGELTFTCEYNADHTYTEATEIDKDNHDLVKVEAQDPDYNNVGWEAYEYCEREGCDYTTYVELPVLADAVAEVNGVKYGTLAEAIAVGGEVKLIADVALTESIKVTNTVTFDLNGKKLTGPDDGKKNWYAFIVDGGNLTFKDSVGTGELYAKCYGVETKSGTFTMDSGKITATKNTEVGSAIVNYGGTVTINDGTLAGVLSGVYTGGYFADATTIINKGEITGPVIVEDWADKAFTETVKSASASYEVIEGYEWTKTDDGYILSAHVHTEGEAVKENEVAADCINGGSYDNVVYCSTCGEELSRETITVPAAGHTDGEIVVENEVAADCTTAGSYDNVTYCTVCGVETSRETITVPAAGHSYSSLVTVPTTCTQTGWMEITCRNCDKTFKSGVDAEFQEYVDSMPPYITITPPAPATGHTEGEAVKENEVAADCTTAGSYDNVTYCTVCNEELTRETVTVAAKGHRWGSLAVTSATCTVDGYITITCGNCGVVADSRYDQAAKDYLVEYPFINVTAKGHTAGETVVENEVAATCTDDGSYDNVVYCTVCDAEISRDTVTVPATGHEWDGGVIDPPAGEYTDGTITYTCGVCGETKTSTIPASGHTHTLTKVEAVAADCTNAGNSAYWYCTGSCAKFFSDEGVTEIEEDSWIIAATGHTEETVPGYAAEFGKPGLTDGVKCSVCGTVITEQTEIPALAGEVMDVEDYKGNGEAVAPEKDGYEFAGWYSDPECTQIYDGTTGEAYAKFVNEMVLTTKVQLPADLDEDSDEAKIRFISSVDSLNYMKVGFKITINGKTKVIESTKVFSKIVSNNDLVVDKTPSDLCADSTHFITYTLTEIPNEAFDTEITVSAYWVTQDGTVVDGTVRTITINGLLAGN